MGDHPKGGEATHVIRVRRTLHGGGQEDTSRPVYTFEEADEPETLLATAGGYAFDGIIGRGNNPDEAAVDHARNVLHHVYHDEDAHVAVSQAEWLPTFDEAEVLFDSALD